jgi:hypothetical protein
VRASRRRFSHPAALHSGLVIRCTHVIDPLIGVIRAEKHLANLCTGSSYRPKPMTALPLPARTTDLTSVGPPGRFPQLPSPGVWGKLSCRPPVGARIAVRAPIHSDGLAITSCGTHSSPLTIGYYWIFRTMCHCGTSQAHSGTGGTPRRPPNHLTFLTFSSGPFAAWPTGRARHRILLICRYCPARSGLLRHRRNRQGPPR